MTKALGLLSGGLDSILAVCVVKEQGIEVTGISFETPFFGPANAQRAAERLGVPLIVRDFTGPHLAMMKKPVFGFGSNMNPCIDCHILMVATACTIMRAEGYDFVFTGEVLNERPMSQNRNSLKLVETRSGCTGYLLRPLSAKLLDETIPEKEGKVDRARLLDLHGRSRQAQFDLAGKYGIKEYPQPAGGCLLTDPGFSRRLRDLRDHEGMDSVPALRLLKIGRHFRLPSGRKIVVGRNERDNRKIQELAGAEDTLLRPLRVPGPTVIVPGSNASEGDLREAARVCARYSDTKPGEKAFIAVHSSGGKRSMEVIRPDPSELALTVIS
jgi:tRNA-uridine 2-sulfurtransferase